MQRKWWTLLAVCVATFMLLLDVTIVNVALPDIQSDLNASFSSLQWVVDAYVLALASFLGGAVNLPLFGHDSTFLVNWLEPVVGENELQVDVPSGTKVALAVIAAVLALVGIGIASLVYLQRRLRPVEPKVLQHAWYYDETVSRFVGGPGRAAFEGVAAFDRNVIDGAVNGVAGGVRGLGRVVRVAQSGFVRGYALGMTAGVVIVLGYFLTRLTF